MQPPHARLWGPITTGPKQPRPASPPRIDDDERASEQRNEGNDGPSHRRGEKASEGGREARRSLQHVTRRVFFLFGGGGGFLANSADAYYNGMRRCCFSPGPSCGKPRQGKASCRR